MTTVQAIFGLRIIYPNYVFSVDFQAEKGVRIVENLYCIHQNTVPTVGGIENKY